MNKMKITFLTVLFLGLSAQLHAQENVGVENTLKLPIICYQYDKEKQMTYHDSITFTLEQSQVNEQFIGTIYYHGKKEGAGTVVPDMVLKWRATDGRLFIGSKSMVSTELRLNVRTGFGIFYNLFGYNVKCSAQ